jgi:flagellar protein FlaG
MAAPVNNTTSVSAGLQMASLAVAQAQQSVGKPAASAPAASAPSTSAATAQPAQTTTAASVTAAAVATASSAKPASSDSSAKTVAQAAEQLQAYFQPQQTVTLNVDKSSGESFVKIVDSQTKQLILQIPSKEVLAMAHKLQEQGTPQGKPAGTLVDQEG